MSLLLLFSPGTYIAPGEEGYHLTVETPIYMSDVPTPVYSATVETPIYIADVTTPVFWQTAETPIYTRDD